MTSACGLLGPVHLVTVFVLVGSIGIGITSIRRVVLVLEEVLVLEGSTSIRIFGIGITSISIWYWYLVLVLLVLDLVLLVLEEVSVSSSTSISTSISISSLLVVSSHDVSMCVIGSSTPSNSVRVSR